jgi:hypothetical protein
MGAIATALKRALGELIAAGHSRFGKVSPRAPYRDENEEGGEGGTGILQHPLFADVPVGAASDLTAVTADHANINDLAEERKDEATPELRKNLEKGNVLTHGTAPKPNPSPF